MIHIESRKPKSGMKGSIGMLNSALFALAGGIHHLHDNHTSERDSIVSVSTLLVAMVKFSCNDFQAQ